MNEKQLKEIFKQGYSFQNWKQVLDFVFGKVEYFSSPNNPFQEDEKVVSGKQYGRIKLDDGKSIALFEVCVDDSINIDRNRQGLREIAAKHIDQNITHGALVFYYSPNQEDYRFTFVAKWSDIDTETGELQKGETQKKRYTYLLGGSQSGTTAAKRLLELANRKPVITIKDIIQAFSVEALTKEFFKKYKEHYERFWRFIDDKPAYQKLLLDTSNEKNDDEKRKPIRDFSKKLLGRIVFLHFLQKKGWLGCSVLNTKKENDEIWIDGNPNFMADLYRKFNDKEHFYSKCLTSLFFNTLNEPDRTNNVFPVTTNRVPYLNGGLFDNDQKHTDSMDFPASYFLDLLEFFEQYNFTIDENSPDEQEVGIDPEMLGHIFENLLEENREKGAFYTPKEIVHYMCQESLVQYLKNHLPVEAKVEDFVREQRVSDYIRDKANATQLNSLLDEVKVCDPAIGSGAFPIGILQEIYKAKIHIYPYLKSQTAFDPAETKKKIIEESIYGVDLEHGAVEIARLRFWLALVVDEDVPQPLPNLDYKIMQGNSLLERFEGIDLSMVTKTKKNIKVVEPERDLFGNVTDSQMKMTFTQTETVKEIQSLIKRYFNEKKPAEKAILKTKINEKVHNHIDFNLELREGQLARLIGEAEAENTLNAKAKAKLAELKKELQSFTHKRARLHTIQNTEEKPYFIWHLFFKDVFDRGGFDIVIGNPPYIQLQKMGREADILDEADFETFSKSGDIYCLFYEKGFKLLKENGCLTFITSNSWLKTKYGKPLRDFFVSKTYPYLLINFEDTLLFTTATVEVNILLIKKKSWDNKLKALVIDDKYSKQDSLNDYFNINGIIITSLDSEGWIILNPQQNLIKELLHKKAVPLKELDVSIYIGILNGFNDAFIIDSKKRDELISGDPKSDEIIKPILQGRDLKKYTYTWNNHWLINTHNGIKKLGLKRIEVQKDYPAIYRHLVPFEKELEIRQNKGDHWTNLRNCGYFLEFEKPKILWGELSDLPKFVYDDSKFYAEATLFAMTGSDLKYLLAVLNSTVAHWYFNLITTTSGMGTSRWKKYKIEQLPVPIASAKAKQTLSTLSDYLIYLYDSKSQSVLTNIPNSEIISLIEKVLNLGVFEIYLEDHLNEFDLRILDLIDLPILEGKELEKRKAIQEVWYWLQQKDNQVRNKILVSDSRSWIIKHINQTTTQQ